MAVACSTAHTHELLLRKSAAQQGVVLEKGSKLLPCVGCSLAKGISAPIHKTTACRSDKKLGRVFVDLTGKQPVKSIGEAVFYNLPRRQNSNVVGILPAH
ncbi:unnamed protein product, partial [Pylaiella littoralis]